MGKHSIHIVLTHNELKLLDQCKKEYLKNHPEMQCIPISRRKIIYEIANYYLSN